MVKNKNDVDKHDRVHIYGVMNKRTNIQIREQKRTKTYSNGAINIVHVLFEKGLNVPFKVILL